MTKIALNGGLALVLALLTVPVTTAQTRGQVDFARDVQPLLRSNCYSCHGPSVQSGGFRLDRRRDSMPNRVGASGARIVPGNSAASRVFTRVSGSLAGVKMPTTGGLPADQIQILNQ